MKWFAGISIFRDTFVGKFCVWLFNHLPFNNKFTGLRGNHVQIDIAVLHRCKVKINGTNNCLIIEDGCKLHNCKIYIVGNNNKCCVEKDVSLHNAELWLEDNGNTIKIGEKTVIAGATHLACTEGTRIDIGHDVLMSSDITVRTGDSHSIVDENGKRINEAESVTIKEHVWICSGVTILKGVSIPANSVVGANTLVTKSFENTNVIIAGNPARIVKSNI